MKGNIEFYILIVALSCITMLDFTGLIDFLTKPQWFQDHTKSIIIGLLTTILYFLVRIFDKYKQINVTLDNRLKSMEENHEIRIKNLQNSIIETIINSLDAPYVKTFHSEREFKDYYITRVIHADESVDDLTWSHKVSASSQLQPTKDQEKILEREIDKKSSNIIYREIFIFSTNSRKAKLMNRLRENTDGYSCSYFNMEIEIPRLQFLIIDKKEVIFTSSVFGQKISIINPVIVGLLVNYFDITWQKSKKLKKGHEWYMNNLIDVLGKDEVEQICTVANCASSIEKNYS